MGWKFDIVSVLN